MVEGGGLRNRGNWSWVVVILLFLFMLKNRNDRLALIGSQAAGDLKGTFSRSLRVTLEVRPVLVSTSYSAVRVLRGSSEWSTRQDVCKGARSRLDLPVEPQS